MLLRLLPAASVGILPHHALILMILLLLESLPVAILFRVELLLFLLVSPVAVRFYVRVRGRALHCRKIPGMHSARARALRVRSSIFVTSGPAAAIRRRVIGSPGLFGANSVVELRRPRSCGDGRSAVVVGSV